MLRFALGDYFLQITKERMLLIISYRLARKKCWKCKGAVECLVWLLSALGRISTDFRKLL